MPSHISEYLWRNDGTHLSLLSSFVFLFSALAYTKLECHIFQVWLLMQTLKKIKNLLLTKRMSYCRFENPFLDVRMQY